MTLQEETMIRTATLVLFSLLSTACASLNLEAPDSEFGARPTTTTLKTTAENYLQQVMFDPESKRIRWFDEEPRRAAQWYGFLRGGWYHGWGMRFGLNGKNRMGGYVGERPYFVIQIDDTIYVGEGSIEVDSKPAAPAR